MLQTCKKNSYLSKHHVTSPLAQLCFLIISPPWRAAGIKALSLRRGHGRTFAKSLAHGMAGGAAGVSAAGCAEAAGTWHQWEGKAWALRKTCRNYWSPSWNIRSSICIYIRIYIYNYTYIYIWSRVKIVYGTFRGVPDVWNEGAS